MKLDYISKEVSWLAFNERVLQEADNPRVPLLERLRFLGIYSSNRDEFFRVRVATLKRLSQLGVDALQLHPQDPCKVLEEVQKIIICQQQQFEKIYLRLEKELAREQIFFRDDRHLDPDQMTFVKRYFIDHLRPCLQPILLHGKSSFPRLIDHAIYLAVEMNTATGKKPDYALLRIPSDQCLRFLQLPDKGHRKDLVMLDDVIRACLPELFCMFEYHQFAAYSFKVTRDAELDLEDVVEKSYTQQLEESLRRRKEGAPVRMTYDRQMPKKMLKLLMARMQLVTNDTVIPGARYLNFKDFMKLPDVGRAEHYYPPFASVRHESFHHHTSRMAVLRQQDVLLHFPYHDFDSFIDLLREAAIDPEVHSIKLTAYRLAKRSSIINTLINAVKNGKKVTVIMELQARFDEQANLHWAKTLCDEGIRVLYGVHGLKVHGKLCLISRREQGKKRLYACVGTGNFNEDTATLYTDHLLLTADKRITDEVAKVFDFLDNSYRTPYFRHLIVAPFHLRNRTFKMIRSEIQAAKAGSPAWIKVKINNLSDFDTVRLLNRAAKAGVKIQLIVRSMFSLVPDRPELHGNIQAISIVDRFLEHSRFFIFCNDEKPRYYISSGDWLPRNFDRRLEVACPVYDPNLQQELMDYFDLQWRENVKARIWNGALDNHYRAQAVPVVQSQIALADFFSRRATSATEGTNSDWNKEAMGEE